MDESEEGDTMKKIVLISIIMILFAGSILISTTTGNKNDQTTITSDTTITPEWLHKERLIVPGSAGFIYKNDLGQVSDYHARNGYYFIRLKPGANDVEFNIPVPRVHITDGKKRWIKAIVIETEGETNNARIDKLEVISSYDTPIKSVSGAAKNFHGRKVNTFDLGGRYAFGGGLTVRLLLDNWDAADERYMYIDYIVITELYN